MLQECIEGLAINPEGTYVDVTFGGGGHSKEILKHLTTGKLYAFDQDADAHENLLNDERFTLIKENFKYMKNFLKLHEATPVDGILGDLGVSSHQFDVPNRGFSTRFDEAELDMRMNQNSESTAKDILKEYSEDQLKLIFQEYGEVRNSKQLAKTIVTVREEKTIKTVGDLKAILKNFTNGSRENKYYAQVFQALRVEVNKELEVLEKFLTQSTEILKTGGRLVIMSYHSLEDKLVKNIIRSGNNKGELEKDFFGNIQTPFKQISKKPIVAREEEIKKNTRARSAKLRIAEKIDIKK